MQLFGHLGFNVKKLEGHHLEITGADFLFEHSDNNQKVYIKYYEH